MRSVIPDAVFKRIIDGSRDSDYRIYIDSAVSAHFRNIRVMTSKTVADCVMLNTLLNDESDESSADEIIRYAARENRALYTSVESIFRSIDDKFDEYARTVVEKLDRERSASGITRFVIYVLSVDCARNNPARRADLFRHIFGYDELLKGIPHY